MKFGFIGLGEMGRPMAINLAKTGNDVYMCDRREEIVNNLIKQDYQACSDFEILNDVEMLFLCLPDGSVVENILLSTDGLLTKLKKCQVIVDFTTMDYEMAQYLFERCRGNDIGYVDAPITGMEEKAINGTLTIMCGGSKKTIEKVKPYLESMGKDILFMGKSGSGQLSKMINNVLFDINCAAISEVLPLAVYLGLDAESITEIINNGTGRSYASEFFLPRALKANYYDGYPMEKAYKDLIMATKITVKHNLPVPMLDAMMNIYKAALIKGFGTESKGAMIKVFEDLFGIECRNEKAGRIK